MEKRYIEIDQTSDVQFDDNELTIEGYAIRFDSQSVLIDGQFYEIIEKRALDNTDFNDVYLFYQHKPEDVLANTASGSLQLMKTERGLFFKAKLPDTTLGQDTYKLIKRGDLRHMSFGFTTNKDTWDLRSEPPIRKINNIDKLYELSIVTYPAYKSTDVSARAVEFVNECKECKLNLQEAKQILEKVKNVDSK